MPSADMRRSTRVFVPKAKDEEVVRVLRSGRRLWVESGEVKNRGSKNGNHWYSLVDNNCKDQKNNGWNDDDVVPMEVDHKKSDIELVNTKPSFENRDRMFKHVYSRKRKRLNGEVSRLSGSEGVKNFGLKFVRGKRKKLKIFEEQGDFVDGLLLSVVNESFLGASSVFSHVLVCVLKHMMRKVVSIEELSGFLLSIPISPVFASFGIRFLRGLSCTVSRGFCRIFGAMRRIPLFTMDFCAAPLSFQQLHATLHFRSVRLSCLCCLHFPWNIESTTDIDEPLLVINDQSNEESLNKDVGSNHDIHSVIKSIKPLYATKFSSRNVHSRLGVTTRSRSKRRRRSVRTRRARNPPPVVPHKGSGPSVSRHLGLKKSRPSLSLALSQELRRSTRRAAADEGSVPKSSCSSSNLNVDIDPHCCYANILVVEADKCYRVERAEVMLDVSDPNERTIAVKKDGLTKYSLKIQREMRPCTTNRITHAVIWTAENGLKLEFPERKDWLIFKELYKTSGEQNVVPSSPVVKNIPVPGVCEVTKSCGTSNDTFKRPKLYIRTTSDELSRALSRKTPSYDMDSEDEEWLGNFNSELDATTNVTEESFELMIDAFEKASYCSPQDSNDEKAAANLCMNVASSAVAEGVYGYWKKKRDRKHEPLNRLFHWQYNQQTRAQLIPKPVLRKKRSLKRQTIILNQRGRGSDSSILQATARVAQQSDENAVSRAEDAKATANKSVEVAIRKREKAQMLMENADLAVYMATMALRIADASQIADSHKVAPHFLDPLDDSLTNSSM